jgi:nitrogen fixation NifU-like protein
MSDLRDLYQEVILDHSKRPCNFRRPESFSGKAEGYNPLCGDRITVYLTVRDGVVVDVAFQGSGCAISTASASMMTQSLRGAKVEEVDSLFEDFHRLLTSEDPPAERLGKLAVFSGVREFPVRVKCATLAWHALRAALASRDVTVSTE